MEAYKTHAFINAKIEIKNLTLNHAKCHVIHIRKVNNRCPNLKTHKENIIKVKTDKYLGDVVSADGKNEENIKK